LYLMLNRFEIVVEDWVIRKRLEDYLFDRFPDLSRSYIREIIRDGRCEVNGRIENRGFRVRGRDFIEIELDLARQTAMRPEPIDFGIIYEDSDVLIADKPAGMLVHPTNFERSGTLLNAVAFYLRNRNTSHSTVRPGLIHRLDKDTSGIIAISKNASFHRALARQFAGKKVDKRYFAVVEGLVADNAGRITLPIGRFAEQKIWDVKPDGKPSITEFSVIKRGNRRTLLEILCITGRTNQIRIHLSKIGHPIVGDEIRGGGKTARLYLHSAKLSFRHPVSGETVKFESPVPEEFGSILDS